MPATCHEASLRFRHMQDEEIVVFARTGHDSATEYLLSKYRNLVESKARGYFLTGGEHEDVVQEGMIGLFKAIRDFRNDRLARLRAFAEVCVTRQILTAVKSATRQKHGALNTYVSLNAPIRDSEDGSLLECMADERTPDPAGWLISRGERHDFHDRVEQCLSTLESQVLDCYLQGKSYREMSIELRCRTKCIDNALQRAKRKIGTVLSGEQRATS